jgi:hypothetical protein
LPLQVRASHDTARQQVGTFRHGLLPSRFLIDPSHPASCRSTSRVYPSTHPGTPVRHRCPHGSRSLPQVRFPSGQVGRWVPRPARGGRCSRMKGGGWFEHAPDRLAAPTSNVNDPRRTAEDGRSLAAAPLAWCDHQTEAASIGFDSHFVKFIRSCAHSHVSKGPMVALVVWDAAHARIRCAPAGICRASCNATNWLRQLSDGDSRAGSLFTRDEVRVNRKRPAAPRSLDVSLKPLRECRPSSVGIPVT